MPCESCNTLKHSTSEHIISTITPYASPSTNLSASASVPFRQVLSKSWELQQVLKTAPKASHEAVHRLSQPVRPRLKHPGDSCSFASYTAGQLSKQRTKREQQRRAEQAYEAAKQEALQGFRRAKAQVSRMLHAVKQCTYRHTASLAVVALTPSIPRSWRRTLQLR
jgi:hypothetical protein